MADGVKLDADFIGNMIGELNTAFPRSAKVQDGVRTISVWREGLAGLDRDAVNGAVKAIIREDEHFPRIARVREMARQWIRRNRGEELRREVDGRSCPNCHEAYELKRRYRLKTSTVLGNAVAFVLTDDQAAALLETFERELCRCAPASAYTPELTRRELCVLVERLMPYDQRRLAEQLRRAGRSEAAPRCAASPSATPAGAIAEGIAERASETGQLEREQHRRREAVA